jgi:hypothetical protein
MPIRLSTTVQKIFSLSNKANSLLLSEFYEYMKSNGVSESHQNNNLKLLIAFARHLGSSSFIDINTSESITNFLNTKLKSIEDDPDRKCLTTWNDYLRRLKYFLRWLHNCQKNSNNDKNNLAAISQSEWETPVFVKIKEKKTKRLSPYSETELWDRDEILSIVKYEPYKRNKAALTLLWDLDARNHEITLLKIKNIRFREKYGEGEIPHEAKTGSG